MYNNVFVISLDKNNKFDYLYKKNLKPILVEGVLGKNLSHQEITENVTSMYSKFGPKSAIGCAMSHIKAWEGLLESDEDFRIVMEDDVIVEEDFVDKFNIVVKDVPTDYDILYLGCFDSSFFTAVMTLLCMSNTEKQINNHVKIPSTALGLHAYVISRKGAETLLSHLKGKIYNHLDFCIQDLSSKGLIKTYLTTPRLAYQTSTDSGISTNVSSSHPLLLNNFLSKFEVDKRVRASYISTLSVIRLGDINVNIMSILFLIFGILMYKYDANTLTILFFLISFKDIFNISSNPNMMYFHYILLMLPSLVCKEFFYHC